MSDRRGAAVVHPEDLFAGEALNALAAHVAVLDSRGVIILVNEAWRRFARSNAEGSNPDVSVGANYLDVCRDAVRRGDATAGDALSGLEAVLRGGRKTFWLEYPCAAPDQERWFRMSVTRFTTGADRYLVVAHDEVTAEKRHAHELQEAGRLLRSVLEALPVGVWIMNRDGRIVQGNSAGVAIWAGARYVGPEGFGEYKGWWVSTGEPIAPEDWAAARAIRTGETSIEEEVEIECFDGTRKIILNSAVPLYDHEGRISGAIIVNQDITARKRAEAEREDLLREHERLSRAAVEANQKKDEFIATLSHELRTPLQSVLGWIAILRRALPDAQASGRAASAIERSAQVLAQLLEDTLDISRIARGDLPLEQSLVDLAALVAGTIETMRPAAIDKGITIVEEVSGARPIVHGDATRLQQIVWNLLSNALKFTPDGGRIEVHTYATLEWVTVAVSDNGMGIAAEFMPFLFERFRQGDTSQVRRRRGLGLGLSIVKELVERHHGTITAESPGEGRGATFTLRLPVALSSHDRLADEPSQAGQRS